MEKKSPPKFHEQLQKIIGEKRLLQKELAVVADVAKGTMSKYVNGSIEPQYTEMQAIGLHYNINMNWLFFGEGKMFLTNSPSEHVEYLRLVQDNKAAAEKPSSPYDRQPKEVIVSATIADAFNAQSNLLNTVSQIMTEIDAPHKVTQEAICAVVQGMKYDMDANAYEKMNELILNTRRALTDAHADFEKIQRAILTIVSGAF